MKRLALEHLPFCYLLGTLASLPACHLERGGDHTSRGHGAGTAESCAPGGLSGYCPAGRAHFAEERGLVFRMYF
jgi:hypothetical protein